MVKVGEGEGCLGVRGFRSIIFYGLYFTGRWGFLFFFGNDGRC